MRTLGFQGSAVIFDTHMLLMRFKNLEEGVAGRNFEHYYMYMHIRFNPNLQKESILNKRC